jgi:hypothetical protein
MLADHEFQLRVVYSVPLVDTATPKTWIRPFLGRIVPSGQDAAEEPVGRITGWIVPVIHAPARINLGVIAEFQDPACHRLVLAVFDPELEGFRVRLDLRTSGDGMLCLGEVSILPAYRGYNLDRVAVWHALQWLGAGRRIAVFCPQPFAERTGEGEELPVPSAEALAQERERLTQYWGQIGFRPVPNYEGYYQLDLGRLKETEPPKIRPRRPQ